MTADNINFLDDDGVNVSAAVVTVRHAKAKSLVSTVLSAFFIRLKYCQ